MTITRRSESLEQRLLSPKVVALLERASELRDSDLEESSKETYRYLRRHYEIFCDSEGLDAFDGLSVVAYIANRVDAREPKSTLRGRLAAIRRAARDANLIDPTDSELVRRTLKGAYKALAAEQRRATPADDETVELLAQAVEGSNRSIALRDRALVLFGFALGRRGAELARIEIDHIIQKADGWRVKIPSTKTNKKGEPEWVGVPRFDGDPLCPIAAMETWIAHAKIRAGPVFLTLSPVAGRGGRRMRREDIARRLEQIAARAGLDGFWRSHSLRRGVVTSAERLNVARSKTMKLTGWRSERMFAVYADHRDAIRDSPLHEIYANRRQQTPKG